MTERSGTGLAVGLLGRAHGATVFQRRVSVLTRELAAAMPRDAAVLDVGCGDGTIARRIMDARPDLTITGIDILVRPRTAIPVAPFDGRTIPYPDGAFDVVSFVDVLHHTDDPTILLREAARVARKAVVLKDHTRDGLLAGPTLRFMDWVGNAPHGVVLPYNYLSRAEWDRAFAATGLRVATWNAALGLYPFPASLLFDRTLHFVSRLDVSRPGPV